MRAPRSTCCAMTVASIFFSAMSACLACSGPNSCARTVQLRPQLKILLTTGYAQDQTIERVRSEPGIILIAKPFGRAELVQKIRLLLQPPSQQCA